MPAVVIGRLRPSHAGVVPGGDELLPVPKATTGGTVVGHEDQDRLLLDTQLGQLAAQAAEVFVDVGDHAVERRLRDIGVAFVGILVCVGNQVRAVGGVGGDEGEERLVAAGLDEVDGLVEPDIGAVAGMADGVTVVEVGVVEIVVAPEIGGLSNAAAAVGDYGLEAAVEGAVGIVVSQMPFAEHAGAVTGGGEDIGHGHLGSTQNRPPPAGCPGAVAHGSPAGHEGASRGSAQGRDVEVAKVGGDRVEGVDLRGADPGVAGAPQVAVALVVGDYENYVGVNLAHCLQSPVVCGGGEGLSPRGSCRKQRCGQSR